MVIMPKRADRINRVYFNMLLQICNDEEIRRNMKNSLCEFDKNKNEYFKWLL